MATETEVDSMFSKKFKFKELQKVDHASFEHTNCTENAPWMVRFPILFNV